MAEWPRALDSDTTTGLESKMSRCQQVLYQRWICVVTKYAREGIHPDFETPPEVQNSVTKRTNVLQERVEKK